MAKAWRLEAAEEKIKALENAFREIASRYPGEAGQGEIFIDGLGRRLWLMRPTESRDLQGETVWPISRVTKKKARILVLKAAAALKGVSPAEAHELGLNWVSLFVLRQQLKSTAAKAAPVRGAPRKDQTRKIGEVVATHYWVLTGKKPTVPKMGGPYGPFLDLMTTVFKILGIKDSALSAAESASRNWKGAKEHLRLGMEFNRRKSSDLIPLPGS